MYDERCRTAYPRQCAVEEQCTMLYTTECSTEHYAQTCEQVPKQTCMEITKCHRNPTTKCESVAKQQCKKVLAPESSKTFVKCFVHLFNMGHKLKSYVSFYCFPEIL